MEKMVGLGMRCPWEVLPNWQMMDGTPVNYFAAGHCYDILLDIGSAAAVEIHLDRQALHLEILLGIAVLIVPLARMRHP